MNAELSREVERLGEDPASPTWQWLLIMGPHGSGFTWGPARREPAGHVGLEHLRRVMLGSSGVPWHDWRVITGCVLVYVMVMFYGGLVGAVMTRAWELRKRGAELQAQQ